MVLRIAKMAHSVAPQFKCQSLGLDDTQWPRKKEEAFISFHHAARKHSIGLFGIKHVTGGTNRHNIFAFEVIPIVDAHHRSQRAEMQKYQSQNEEPEDFIQVVAPRPGFYFRLGIWIAGLKGSWARTF
jgi:hypothetical protein